MKKLIASAIVGAAITAIALAATGDKNEMYAFFAYKFMNTQLKGEVKTLTMNKDAHSMYIEYFNGETATIVVPENSK